MFKSIFKKNKPKQKYKIKTYKADRRNNKDRRSFGAASEFPLFDSKGNLVKKDRRVLPDRRIANIQVQENQISVENKSSKDF